MRRFTWFGAGVAWLLVVVAVSALTWTVIDSAGQDVLGRDVSANSAAPPIAGDPTTGVPSPRVTASTEPGVVLTERPKPSGQPSVPSATPAVPLSSAPSPTPVAPPPSTSTPKPAPQPQAQVRSWQGAAGSVVARCIGGRISLQSASPNDGWTVKVDSRGPEHVEVEFRSRDGDRRTKVEAQCSGGVPRFSVENETEGGDG